MGLYGEGDAESGALVTLVIGPFIGGVVVRVLCAVFHSCGIAAHCCGGVDDGDVQDAHVRVHDMDITAGRHSRRAGTPPMSGLCGVPGRVAQRVEVRIVRGSHAIAPERMAKKCSLGVK
jgi:hypothetical protein